MTSSWLACLLPQLTYNHAWTLCLMATVRIYQRHPGRVSGARHKQIPQRKQSVYDSHPSELRLPFTTSYARNIAVKCRERWQMTFFSAPARGRLIPVYCRKWGASDICLKLKPNKALCSFFLCGRCKTLQTWERQSWDKIWTPKSNYKRQMTLISHKVWQLLSTCKETVSLTLSLSLALSVSHVSFSDKCLGALDRFPPLHTKWVITSFFFYRIEEGCSCLAVCFADFPPPRL